MLEVDQLISKWPDFCRPSQQNDALISAKSQQQKKSPFHELLETTCAVIECLWWNLSLNLYSGPNLTGTYN